MQTFMVLGEFQGFMHAMEELFLSQSKEVPVGEWQSQDVSQKPEMVTWEIEDFGLGWRVPFAVSQLQEEVRPNLPWAEEHFQERVGGVPLNPPPSHERWPFRRKNNEEHMPDGRFSHTYPERFWPKHAGECPPVSPDERCSVHPHGGIRFAYGDLGDVVAQLKRNPLTRQAYLPVWFPEDTGAVHGERVPCTLGYWFRVREGKLNCTYAIRSCDFMRHFADDVYMAARLMQWVCDQMDPNRGRDVAYPQPGQLTMNIGSFHVFAGDRPILQARIADRRRRGV